MPNKLHNWFHNLHKAKADASKYSDIDKLTSDIDKLTDEQIFSAIKIVAQKDLADIPGKVYHDGFRQLEKNEFLEKLASLCDEFRAEFLYTNDDDGIHITMDGKEIFVGYMENKPSQELRKAKSES